MNDVIYGKDKLKGRSKPSDRIEDHVDSENHTDHWKANHLKI